MDGLLGWTTPFIWTMPGLPLADFPVPFPEGLPADGLLVAALPLTAFLRDMSQDFIVCLFLKKKTILNRHKQTKSKSNRNLRKVGPKSWSSEEVKSGDFFHLCVKRMFLDTFPLKVGVNLSQIAVASVVDLPLPALDRLLFPGQQLQHCA